jgi:hypothetical protein
MTSTKPAPGSTWRDLARPRIAALRLASIATIACGMALAFVHPALGFAALVFGFGSTIQRAIRQQLKLALVLDCYASPETQAPTDRLDWLRFRREQRVPVLEDLDQNERDELAVLEQATELGWIGGWQGVRTIAQADAIRRHGGRAVWPA